MGKFSKRLKAGDTKVLEEIYKEYWSSIYFAAYKVLNSKEDSEELVQDVFLNIWNNREKIDEEKSLKPFLFTIANRRIIDRLRKKIKLEIPIHLSKKEISDSTTENAIHYNELADIAEHLIEQLPPKRKLIFNLRRNKGYTNKEIADQLGISTTMVERQIKLAYETIRKKLNNKGVSISITLLFFFDFFLNG